MNIYEPVWVLQLLHFNASQWIFRIRASLTDKYLYGLKLLNKSNKFIRKIRDKNKHEYHLSYEFEIRIYFSHALIRRICRIRSFYELNWKMPKELEQ